MTNETKKSLKLLLLSTSALAALVGSYVLFFLVSWKLVFGILLTQLSVALYNKLMLQIAKNQIEEQDSPAIHDDIEKNW